MASEKKEEKQTFCRNIVIAYAFYYHGGIKSLVTSLEMSLAERPIYY